MEILPKKLFNDRQFFHGCTNHSSNIEHFRMHSYTVLANKGYFYVKPFYVYVLFNSNS
jgi:hypothetical protein